MGRILTEKTRNAQAVELVDKDTMEVIKRCTALELADYLDVRRATVYKAITHNHTVKRRYKVRYVDL